MGILKLSIMCSEIPSNLVLKKVSPRIWLPALTVAWGIVTMCLGFVKNYTGFMIVRAVLGITEGGLLPGIVSSQHAICQFSSTNGFTRFCICRACTLDQRWLSELDYSTHRHHSVELLEVCSFHPYLANKAYRYRTSC